MTLTWVLVAAIVAGAVVLLAVLWKSSRSTPQTATRSGMDFLAALSPVIAALTIGGFGIVIADRVIDSQEARATRERQQQTAQDRVRERNEQVQRRLDTVERLLPQFSKGEQEKHDAILAIRAAGDFELAATLAGLFPSTASVSALETIARQAAPYERQPAVTALAAMDTPESRAALTRVYDDVIRSLVPFDGEADNGGHPKEVVAGVIWNDRWLFVPMGKLVHAKPRDLPQTEERGRQSYGDGLTRVRAATLASNRGTLAGAQFSSTVPERGDAVLAIGLDAEGRPTYPRSGVVTAVETAALQVHVRPGPEQIAGSLLVLPSGQAVGMLSHEQPRADSYRYIRSDDVLNWFAQLDREDQERQRRK